MTAKIRPWMFDNWQSLVLLLLALSKGLGLWFAGWPTLIALGFASIVFSNWLTKLAGGHGWRLQNWLILLLFCLIWLPFGLGGLTSSLQAGVTLSAPLQNQLFQTRYSWMPILGLLDVILMLFSIKWLGAYRNCLRNATSWSVFWQQGWHRSWWHSLRRIVQLSWQVLGRWVVGISGLLLVQWIAEPFLSPTVKWVVAASLLSILILWTWLSFLRLMNNFFSHSVTVFKWPDVLLCILLALVWLAPFSSSQPLVIAHRGVDANDGVQNTTQALRRTVRHSKPNFVEIDIQQTADRHFIVLHDETLWHLARRRIKAGQKPLNSLNGLPVQDHGKSARLSSFRNYQQLAAAIRQPLIVEIKVAPTDSSDMVSIFSQHYQQRLLSSGSAVHSLDYRVVAQLKKVAPALRVGYITPFNLSNLADNAADFYSLQSITLSREQILAAHRQHKPVAVWTVDYPWSTVHCWALGADGLITNQATQTKKILAHRQHAIFWELVNWVTQLF